MSEAIEGDVLNVDSQDLHLGGDGSACGGVLCVEPCVPQFLQPGNLRPTKQPLLTRATNELVNRRVDEIETRGCPDCDRPKGSPSILILSGSGATGGTPSVR